MSEIDQAVARLRLSLAEIQTREGQLDQMIRQFRLQLRRTPRQAIYGRTPLEVALSAMGEVEERLSHTLTTREHLLAIKKQAEEELRALEVTREVEEAKRDLQKLRLQVGAQAQVDEAVLLEMRRLEEFIAEYSKVAERAITGMYQGGAI